ncbi:hypothetical protein WA026_005329 [Henosepilachna vigintioctopunctata]|uniref:Spermatogenesis-associated protein 17 n=1 Tax=Henosepilachna vigintioctopunctata TaxID=420089 RepID=A0AAW1UUB6_9CUCU
MASVYYLIDDAQDIADNVIANTEAKFDLDKKRFFAALLIQRTFRGYVVRNEYKKWWTAAVIIQKNVRGFLQRINLLAMAEELFKRKCFNLFNRMALKIQSAWRGYWVRKSIRIKEIMDQKKREQEEFVAMQKLFMEIFKKRMQGSSEFSLGLEILPEHLRHLHKITKKTPDIIKSLFDRHHLLRTYQTEGVFSIHDSKEFSVLEQFLKRIDYKPYMNNVKKIFESSPHPEVEYMFKDKRTRKMEDLFRTNGRKDECLKKNTHMNKFSGVSTRDKPFKLIPKVPDKPYDRSLMAQELFTGTKPPVFRDRIKQDISEHDFDLGVHNMEQNQRKETPYLIESWKRSCCNHNIMNDCMEKNG